MSNALLLRLFTSEHFNSWIAVSYLFRYPDNVGIQHYLCSELKTFPISEIEFFLPQLMHLLITRPSEPVALECFLIEMCESSTHMALMSLWYLQAYLSDLSANPTGTSFDLCKRLLNKCQAIVFSDGHSVNTESASASASLCSGITTNRIRENALPALIGMGAMLASIGQPAMTKPAGQIAIAQGRKNISFGINSLTIPLIARRNTLTGSSPTSEKSSIYSHQSLSKENVDSESRSPADSPTFSTAPRRHTGELFPHYQSASQPDLPISKRKTLFAGSPSLEDLHRGRAFSVFRNLKTAHQKINRKIRSNTPQSPTSKDMEVFDPKLTALGQSSVPTNEAPLSPALSQYSASSEEIHRQSRSSHRKSAVLSRPSTSFESTQDSESDQEYSDDEFGLSKLPSAHRRSLLRSNYFRSEMQFLLALVDIATRLVIVPKSARMSALHAELTLLNHNLPAEICIPLWCPATAGKPFHHRVVRISPSDAVVLNSAERAPYLLMIEVLDDEMSFEKPTKVSRPEPEPAHAIDISDCKPTQSVPSVRSVSSRRNSHSGDEYAERMRTAAIMLAQLQQSFGSVASTAGSGRVGPRQGTEPIRQRIIKEMSALEEQRMAKMASQGVSSGVGGGESEGTGGNMLDDEQRVSSIVHKEDPSAAVFSEDWETKKTRIRSASPYGHLPNWRLLSVIVKNGADLRQEQFAIQLIREMQRIWEKDSKVDVWVKYYRVLVTSDSSGLIETLRNTISVHSIKKDAYIRGWNTKGVVFTLGDYFEKRWGNPDSEEFIKAQDAFMRSLAGYSITCYILQIKDRHNGNLLIDDAGHLIHIDFGFMLSNSPGSVGFEMAPFKLPQEYIDILGGVHGEKFAEYKALMKEAFLAVRKHSENILLLVEMMSKDSKLPCFQNGEQTIMQLRDRFQLQLTVPQAEEFVDRLIMSSFCNVFTRFYDTYQYYSQGIL